MSLCIKFTDRESECHLSPLSPELLLPLFQLPGHTFLSSSLAMLLLQPRPRLHAFVRPKDRMASYGWLNFLLFSIPCCPDGVKLWGRFCLESPMHLATGSFTALLSGGPSHCIAWNTKHSPQPHKKKAIKHLHCVALMVLQDLVTRARLLQPGPNFVPVLWRCWLQRCARHTLVQANWIQGSGNLRKTHSHNPTEIKTFTWIHWSINKCPQEMLWALRGELSYTG